MQSLKLILKHETNFKTTLKIMNAHEKLKMTLNMEFDHLAKNCYFTLGLISWKEIWVPFLHVFFGFPCSTLNVLVPPKHFNTFYFLVPQPLNLSIKNLNRHLFIAQILFNCDILQWKY